MTANHRWKNHLRDLGVSMIALKFLPDTPSEAKFEISRWTTRGRLAGVPFAFQGEVADELTVRFWNAFAIWRAAVRHVLANMEEQSLNSNAYVTVQGTATLVVASQWAAFGETLEFHPAFEGLRFMKEDPFMEAIQDALNTFGLPMQVGASKMHLWADAVVSESTTQRIIELWDEGAAMIPPVFQHALVKAFEIERTKSGLRPFGETEFGFCFDVDPDEAGWKALAEEVELRWQASIQEGGGRL